MNRNQPTPSQIQSVVDLLIGTLLARLDHSGSRSSKRSRPSFPRPPRTKADPRIASPVGTHATRQREFLFSPSLSPAGQNVTEPSWPPPSPTAGSSAMPASGRRREWSPGSRRGDVETFVIVEERVGAIPLSPWTKLQQTRPPERERHATRRTFAPIPDQTDAPVMGTPEWEAFVEDIRLNGIKVPLGIQADGTLVEGETRRRAALVLKTPDRLVEVIPDDEVAPDNSPPPSIAEEPRESALAYVGYPRPPTKKPRSGPKAQPTPG